MRRAQSITHAQKSANDTRDALEARRSDFLNEQQQHAAGSDVDPKVATRDLNAAKDDLDAAKQRRGAVEKDIAQRKADADELTSALHALRDEEHTIKTQLQEHEALSA